MKKRYVYGSVIAIILGTASYQLISQQDQQEADQYQVAYIDTKDEQQAEQKAEETPEQVSAREGIDAEQIVVKITDKGYVTLHGDHYHFYSGKVPYDAIISEELLMKDPNYVFKQEDVVTEVKDGYIIKVGDQYYLYLKAGVQPTNVRTKQEIEDQQQQSGSSKSSSGQQTGGQTASQVGGSNGRRYQTSDGYVFDPTHVIDDLGDAFLVPHGTHFHYIPKKDLTPEELAAAQAYWDQKKTQPQQAGQSDNPTPVHYRPTPTPPASSSPQAPGKPAGSQTPNPWDSNDWRVLLRYLYSLPLEQRYREADGYLFDPAKIVRRLDYGVVVPHGDHFHVILYAKLSPLEQKIARLIPLMGEPGHPSQPSQPKPVAPKDPGKPKGPDKPKTPTPPSKPKEIILHFQGRSFPAVKKGLDGQPYSTSDGYVFSKASIYSVDKDGITVQHGSHFHFVPFNELEQYELDQVTAWLVEQAGQTMTIVDLEKRLKDLEAKAKTLKNETQSKEFIAQINQLRARLAAIKAKTSRESVQAIQAEISKLAAALQKTLETPTPPGDKEQDEVAVKRAYLARETGVDEEDIELLDTPDGPAFKYPHDDHYHVILLSKIDVTKPYNDGHGGPGHKDTPDKSGDDHKHDGHDNHKPDTQPVDKHDEDKDEPIQPTPQVDEVVLKRAYLAKSTGLPETKIILVDTPQGPAFMYPHDDHHHLVLLSNLDVTKPYNDGHGGPGHKDTPDKSGDDHKHDGHDNHKPDTQPVDKHDEDKDKPIQPTPQVDEVVLKRAYLAKSTGLSETKIILVDTPQGPAFMYPHDDHHHLVLLSNLDVTKPYNDGHGSPGHKDTPDKSNDGEHGSGNDGGTSLPPGKNPGDKEQDEVAQKRAYLARELGVSEDKIELLDTPDGPAFKYPHDDHYHVILLSKIDVTKPFDASHDGDHDTDNPKKEGVAGIDYPTSDGFLFDGTGMQGWTNIGLLVNHNGHTHLLLKEDIAKSKWAYLLPKEDGGKPADQVTLTPAQSQQRQALADALKLPLEKILVVTADGKVIGFNYPHEDHYDFVPVVDEGGSSTELTDEEKRELTAYIRKAYGLLLGTPVDFKESVVIFAIPHPHQDYDPSRDYYSDVLDPSYDKGHVHPYFVPISKLKIPAKTGIPELDFENELLVAAERLGVPVGQVKMKNDKYFVLPGADHDHYLNIFSLDGLKAYRENSLKLIYPRIMTGSFDKDTVAAEIDRIQEAAKARFGDETLEYRRVRRALTQYREEIAVGHRSSTQAYVEALKVFEKRYVLLQDGDTADQETNSLEARAATFMDTVNRLGNTKLSTYGTSVDTLVNRIREAVVAQDSQALDAVERYLEAIARVESAPNPHLPRVAYMDYFLRHVDSPYLSYDLREAVSNMVMELHQHDMKRTSFKPSLEAAVALKAQVKAAIAAAQNQEIKLGTSYNKLNRMKVELVGRVNHWANIFKYAITEEEKAEGFNGKLQVLPAIKPVKQKDPNPPADQPEKPKDPTPSPQGSLEEQLAAWLEKTPNHIKRLYGVDKWAEELTAAIAAKDQSRLQVFATYVAAIQRVEEANKGNHVGARTAYLDYFIRQADQAYLSPELREEVANKAIFIQTANTRDFKQALIDLINLKAQVKAAQAAGQTYEVSDSATYQAFLDKRDVLMTDVLERKDYLLRIGYITEEEKADGFGQAFPDLRPRPAAGAPAQPSTSSPAESSGSSDKEAPAEEQAGSEADQVSEQPSSPTSPTETENTSETETTTEEETDEEETESEQGS